MFNYILTAIATICGIGFILGYEKYTKSCKKKPWINQYLGSYIFWCREIPNKKICYILLACYLIFWISFLVLSDNYKQLVDEVSINKFSTYNYADSNTPYTYIIDNDDEVKPLSKDDDFFKYIRSLCAVHPTDTTAHKKFMNNANIILNSKITDINALEEKYNVTTMINGRMAERFLESKTCDLILLDYEMPIENGPEVFRELRMRENSKDIPIVFLTGVADTAKIAEVLRLKPQGYLLKPIEMERLFETIDKILKV
mgnify:CR=1 FL=1